ncbi:flavin-containing monooxygenase [Acinetobacter chinensis]|uniref:flavin-containing monooxygenase n=1 Tax=Acinetobacter chinensis TaxID=2004650 RepID=UPI0029350950|nr:NAD(P)/FAD-dependent oxidoreductase [Acinetobacter chinensis]WOE40967.1 NAD(P)/FAD-dependent oxidoreductase [Acinetobacter chinensis]
MNNKILDVAILGSGFGGLGMATRLKDKGIENFQIFEKSAELGGVWRDNIYPGAACDTEAHLYCFSYFPNLRVSRMYAGQQELLDYLNRFADHFHLREKIQFSSEIIHAAWNNAEQLWDLQIKDKGLIKAKVFVPAWGQLNKAVIPQFKGLENFKGQYFHSAEWDTAVDLKGKKVVSIGSAASAVQYIPEVAVEADHLTVFQRSANWIMPRNQVVFTEAQLDEFEQQPEKFFDSRNYLHNFRENGFDRTQQGTDAQKEGIRVALEHLHKHVQDEELRQKLTPDYEFGCKRILRTDDYYPALARENVSLVTDAIAEITAQGIQTAAGEFIEADVIIFGTGFASQNFNGELDIVGAEDTTLSEAWQDGAAAYIGLTVPSFCNMFLVYGPNTNLNHNSIVSMLEIQHQYIADSVEYILENNASLDVKQQVFEEYNEDIQARMAGSAFSSDCSSWYKNAAGKVINNWPLNVETYRHYTVFNADDFSLGNTAAKSECAYEA